MRRWKRVASAWMAVVLLWASLGRPALGSETESAPEARDFEFSIGIYNELAQDYALPNRTIDAFGAVTVDRSIAILLQKGMLDSYTQAEDRLLSISYHDDKGISESLNESETRKFYVKLNGEAMRPEDAAGLYIHDGDLIEWIFTTASEYDKLPVRESAPASSSQLQEPAPSWTPAASAAQSAACDWLDDQVGSSAGAGGAGYLAAVGSAGRSANINAVNRLLAVVRKTESDADPAQLARLVLDLSYCGFDTSNPDLSSLLERLMNLEGRASWPTQELCAVLTAYDCRGYNVPGGVANSRGALVDTLLSRQREDGAFSDGLAGGASPLATANAVTALASYAARSEVKTAVSRAVDYLAKSQSDDGLFRIVGQDSSEALSQVIIALLSADVPLRDKRFVKKNENLLSLLLRYQQPDGGFAPSLRGKSDAVSTVSAVIALSALHQGGNPYRIPSSLKNTVPISSQTPLQEIGNDRTGYWIAGIALFSLFVLAVLAVVILKRSRK